MGLGYRHARQNGLQLCEGAVWHGGYCDLQTTCSKLAQLIALSLKGYMQKKNGTDRGPN